MWSFKDVSVQSSNSQKVCHIVIRIYKITFCLSNKSIWCHKIQKELTWHEDMIDMSPWDNFVHHMLSEKLNKSQIIIVDMFMCMFYILYFLQNLFSKTDIIMVNVSPTFDNIFKYYFRINYLIGLSAGWNELSCSIKRYLA